MQPEATPAALLVEDEPLLRDELKAMLARLWPELRIVAEAGDGLEAARALAAERFDVVFLDIRIPGMSGLELAELASGRCHVVFITAHGEHAVAAFEKGAVDYLMKPLDSARLQLMIERVKQRLDAAPADLRGVVQQLRQRTQGERIRWIQASVGNRIRIVGIDEVVFFQADAKYTKVVSQRGEMHIRRTIKELSEELDGDAFWQISRGTIINVAHIEEVKSDGDRLEVHMRAHAEPLGVSRTFHHLFRRM